MNDPMEFLEAEVEKSIATQRKRAIAKIVTESGRLVDELLLLAYSQERDEEGRPIVDVKIKLAAITILLDRGIPKLAVDNAKSEKIDDGGTRKKMAAEIAALVRGEKRSQMELEIDG